MNVTGRVVVLCSGGRGDIVDLGPDAFSIGRDSDNDLVLDGGDVSRRHARLEPHPGGGHRVVDLGSVNGVTVNDRRVGSVTLEPFDRIKVGDHLLVYLDSGSDGTKLLRLLSAPDTTSTWPGETGPSRLKERLLFHILLVQQLASDADYGPEVGPLLEDLLREMRLRRALLVTLDGAPRGRVRAIQRAGVDGLTVDQLEACRGLVERALHEEAVVRGPTPLAPGQDTLCVPMQNPWFEGPERRRQAAGRVQGALLLADGPLLGLNGEVTALLRVLTRQLAILLSNARLHAQATTDPLTGLASRGCLEPMLQAELESAAAGDRTAGVALLDVDDFKRLNDTFGHPAGDGILREVARRLQRQLRHHDLAGRWGGEEFLVVLPGADLAGCRRAVAKLVEAVGAEPVDPPGVRVTVSAGVAVFPEHALVPELLVQRADQALYAAKAAGKDRLVVYRSDLPMPGAGVDLTRTQTRFRPAPTPIRWLRSEVLGPIALTPGRVRIGRTPTADLVLPHPRVSRRHAELRVSDEGEVVLVDTSTNGTQLNGDLVHGAEVRLRPGDALEIGPFAFELLARTVDELQNETLRSNLTAVAIPQLEQQVRRGSAETEP